MDTTVVSYGHNRLAWLARKIQASHDRCIKGGADWIEASIELATSLREGSDSCPSNISFSEWLKTNGLNFYNHSDRNALIQMARNPELMRTVLAESKSRSYQL